MSMDRAALMKAARRKSLQRKLDAFKADRSNREAQAKSDVQKKTGTIKKPGGGTPLPRPGKVTAPAFRGTIKPKKSGFTAPHFGGVVKKKKKPLKPPNTNPNVRHVGNEPGKFYAL